MKFEIKKKLPGTLARAGTLETAHGSIETPAFVTVGTKATVKALSTEEVAALGGEVVLANTYHLYLQPGEELVRRAGGLGAFMRWPGPTMTDSGGFQVFSLGAAYDTGIGKLSKKPEHPSARFNLTCNVEPCRGKIAPIRDSLVRITEDGVTFRSHLDGSEHHFTPERSMEIQHNLGADMIFAFDECTSPSAPYEYQIEAMARTHRWAERSLAHHHKIEQSDPLGYPQALFGIVQGGRHQDLREESARVIGEMKLPDGMKAGAERGFDGFGIGGSFDKEDMGTAVAWVNRILPEEKPRHLLGIGDPRDLFLAVENGCDLFDCVAPTRQARNGSLYTSRGRINITNARYRTDLAPIDPECTCAVCAPNEGSEYNPKQAEGLLGNAAQAAFSRAYLAHLFRADELLAYRLASIHNLHFIVNLVKKIRASLLEDTFFDLKENFLSTYALGSSTPK